MGVPATYSLFVDGSSKNISKGRTRRNSAKRGAFAVVAVKGDVYSSEATIQQELFGILITDEQSKFYLSITSQDNHNSEMVAAGEALLHILQTPDALLAHELNLFGDNESVIKCLQGEYNGDHNIQLYTQLREWITEINTRRNSVHRSFLQLFHIRSHAVKKGIVQNVANTPFRFNERADHLAQTACDNGISCKQGRFGMTSDYGSVSSILSLYQNSGTILAGFHKRTIDYIIGSSTDGSIGLSIATRSIEEVLQLVSFSQYDKDRDCYKECLNFIKENCHFNLLFRADHDKDAKDSAITSGNGLCAVNVIHAMNQNILNNWGSKYPQTQLPQLRTLEDRDNFIAEIEEYKNQVDHQLQHLYETLPDLQRDRHKLDKFTDFLTSLNVNNMHTATLSSEHWLSDQITRYIRRDMPRMLLREHVLNSSFDVMISNTINPERNITFKFEHIESLCKEDVRESIQVGKIRSSHFFPSTGEQEWKTNADIKVSEAVADVTIQLLAYSTDFELSLIPPPKDDNRFDSDMNDSDDDSATPMPPPQSSSKMKEKVKNPRVDKQSSVGVTESNREYIVSRITNHRWEGKKQSGKGRKLEFYTYWLTEDGNGETNDSDFYPLNHFPANNLVLQQYIMENNLQRSVPKKYLAPMRQKNHRQRIPTPSSPILSGDDSSESESDQNHDASVFDSRHYHPDHGPNTRLIDIPFDMIGILVANTLSTQDIPEQLRGRVRKVYIAQLLKIKRNPQSSIEWLKFMLLPTIIFGKYVNSVSNKAGMKRALTRLQNDDWSFTLSEFMKKRDPTKPSKATTQEIMHKKAMVCAQKGEISKAMAIIARTSTLVLPTQQVIQNLQSKFPANNQHMFSDKDIKAFRDYIPPQENRIEIKPETLRRIICSRHNMVRPSTDGLRYEHLKQIIGKGQQTEMDEITITKLLSEVMEYIINDEAPREYMNALAQIELVPLLKENGDLRPIGMNFAIRKVVSLLIIHTLKVRESKDEPTFLENHLPPLQMALESNGTEKIAHAMALDFELNPERCKFAIDGINSFNTVSRNQALINVRKHVPHILPFVRAMYGHSSKAWYYGLKEGITHIDVNEGSTQGDVLGTFCYAMAIHPFLQEMKRILGDQGFLAFFVDDGNVSADFDTMCAVLDYVDKEGAKYGYFINKDKGSYCMGKCGSYDIAVKRKQILINLGLLSDIIHIHPDDIPAHFNNDVKESTFNQYGMKVLGVFMGSAQFIQLNLSSKIKKLSDVKDKIIAFPDKQVRNLILRWSFCAKINYLMRTTPPALIVNFIQEFNRLKKEILCSLINDKHFPSHDYTQDNLPERIWKQAQLHINEGGLGLHDHVLTSHAAYLASLTEATPYISNIHTNFTNYIHDIGLLHPRLVDYRNSVSVINSFDSNFTISSLPSIRPEGSDMTLQNAIMRRTRSKVIQEFESSITYAHDLAWLKCLQDNNAGLWLERAPTANRFHLDTMKFTVALRYRLRLRIPSINEGSYCSCKPRIAGSNKLDVYGYHLTILCGKHGYRNKIHDGIVLTINACCHANGMYTQHEPRNLLHIVDDENNKRPDLLLINPPGFTDPRVVIDVNVTHPLRRSTTIAQAKTFRNGSIAALAAEKNKIKKFSEECASLDIGFHALIFESSGKPSSNVVNFILKVISNNSEAKGMDPESNLRYWMSALSFNIQTNIANSIIQRSSILHASGQSKIYHKDSCPDHVHASDCINGIRYTRSPIYDKNYTFHDNYNNNPYSSASQDDSLFDYSKHNSPLSPLSDNFSQHTYDTNSTFQHTTHSNVPSQSTISTLDAPSGPKKRSRSIPTSPVSPSFNIPSKKSNTISFDENDNVHDHINSDFSLHNDDINDTMTQTFVYDDF